MISQIARKAAQRLDKEFSSFCGRTWVRFSCNLQRSVSQAILNRIDGAPLDPADDPVLDPRPDLDLSGSSIVLDLVVPPGGFFTLIPSKQKVALVTSPNCHACLSRSPGSVAASSKVRCARLCRSLCSVAPKNQARTTRPRVRPSRRGRTRPQDLVASKTVTPLSLGAR